MGMRKNAYWMKQEDDRILEYLDREGWATAGHIASKPAIDISEGHVQERLKFLTFAGLVWEVWPGGFEITTYGKRYLEGSIDASHLPTPTVDRVLRG